MPIRPFDSGDTGAVVDLSLRAWAPVHVSIREALTSEINDALQPDWRALQERDVREVLSGPTTNVWVAEVDQVVAGFVAVRMPASNLVVVRWITATTPFLFAVLRGRRGR